MGTADKDYFLDAEGNIADSEETAATLLIRAGQEVPKEMADKYGIGKVTPQEDGETATVKADKPKSNKSEKPTNDKGAK